jgi:RNA recognition motif-containing protein
LLRKSATIATQGDVSKGFGYVEMETPELAQIAIEKLNRVMVEGKNIRVEVFREGGRGFDFRF